jgi:hypothetical protein
MNTKSPRTIVWFSCGAASAVAAKLTPKAVLVYCETGSEHPDNERFLSDVEDWCGRKVKRLKSTEYQDTWDVWEKRRYLAGVAGAPCTTALKVEPRLMYQYPTDIHVFGYTNDGNDRNRASRLKENYPELKIKTPLISRYLTKSACISLISRAGIKPPILYGLGFQNNNCIPCVKATSPSYWALIRKEFPKQFARMAKLSRELDVRLCKLKDERIFIDEIPLSHPTVDPIQPSCDFLCQAAEFDYLDE